MNNENENFLKPILSTFGLLIAFLTAIAPLFTKTKVVDSFINQKYATPASFTALALGTAIAWLVIDTKYINFGIGKLKDRGSGYPQRRYQVNEKRLVLSLLVLNLIFFFLFFWLSDKKGNIAGIIQAVTYILFFVLFIAVFSTLLTMTKSKYDYQRSKDRLGDTVIDTLRRNKLINEGIVIYENKQLSSEEAQQENVQTWGVRKFRVETVKQEKEVIDIILSDDARELIKVVKKHGPQRE